MRLSKTVMVFILLVMGFTIFGSTQVDAASLPPYTLYGNLYYNDVMLTENSVGSIVYAKKDDVVIAQYEMGSFPPVGNYYLLEIPMDSENVPDSAQAGDLIGLFIQIKNPTFDSGEVAIANIVVGNSGAFKRMHLYAFGPLAIELSSFDAQVVASGIQIRWRTEVEIDNLGFNVYRKNRLGEYEKLNSNLIAAQGAPWYGADYSIVDRNVEWGKTYTYMLEDVDVYGHSNFHGPISVRYFATPMKYQKLIP